MALKYPSANGNWSNAANWNGGTVPVSGDDVRANGFTVTIDVDINVLQISTSALAPAAAGGSFVVSTNRTLTCDVNTGTTVCLSSSAGITVNLIGNIYGAPSGVGGNTISFTNSGSILNVTGIIYGAANNSGSALITSGTLNFVGNVFGGALGASSNGITISSGGNLVFTGNITAGGGTTNAIIFSGNSSTINGNIYGGTTSARGLQIGSGTHIINANCYGSNIASSGSHALGVSSAISVVVNGTVYAGSVSTSFGLISAATTVQVSNIEFTNGNTPVSGFVKFKNTAPTITVTKANNTTQQLVDPSTTDIPIEGNVRDGVSYASGSLTGTLKVPPASSVAVGVPVDNTVGTAIISISDMGALLASYNA
jgi:hypothetical protein